MASIKRNFAYNALLNVSRVIFPLITAPYISRVLEPDGIGLFNFANTYAGYFALFAVLGIPTYGIREVAKRHDDKEGLSKLVSELISISFIATFIVTLIYVASIFLVGQLDENRVLFLVAGFVLYFAPFRIDWFYSGLEQFKYITLRTVVIRTVSIICMFVFVRTKSDLLVYMILNVCGTICGDVWNYVKLLRSGIRPRLIFVGLKKHLSPLFILFASTIAISIYTVLDTLMLGFMTDYQQVGYYNNAMHLSKAVLTIVTSLSAVAIPQMSQYYKAKEFDKINDLANKSFLIISFIAFPAAVGIACLAPTFVPLFFGAEFSGSVVPLMILSLLIVAIGLNNLSGVQILIGIGYDKLFLYSVLCGTVSNFLLNLFLIPVWGANGASIASVFAESLILGVTIGFVYRKTSVRITQYKEIFKSLGGSILFIPAIIILNQYLNGWTLVFIFIFCGFGIYLLSQKILKNKSLNLILPIVLRKLHLQ